MSTIAAAVPVFHLLDERLGMVRHNVGAPKIAGSYTVPIWSVEWDDGKITNESETTLELAAFCGVCGHKRRIDYECSISHGTPTGVVTNAVNHPPHYTSDPSGVECISITRHRNFNIGNAIKYLWRAGLKGDGDQAKHIEDLEKACWYIADEIDRLRGSKTEMASQLEVAR